MGGKPLKQAERIHAAAGSGFADNRVFSRQHPEKQDIHKNKFSSGSIMHDFQEKICDCRHKK